MKLNDKLTQNVSEILYKRSIILEQEISFLQFKSEDKKIKNNQDLLIAIQKKFEKHMIELEEINKLLNLYEQYGYEY